MALTYATVEEVSGAILTKSAEMTEERISGAILMAEGIVDAVMQKSGRAGASDFTFNHLKHGLIKDATIAIAASHCIAADVSEFTSVAEAALEADLFWARADRNLAILSNKAIVYSLIKL